MTGAIDIRELSTRFRELLDLATSGQEVILFDGAAPRARLIPIHGATERVAGLHEGAMQMSTDFDAPLPDDFWAGKT